MTGQELRTEGQAESEAPALAYLVSQYPAISHTFVLREARALRERGLRIETLSVRDADRSFDRLTAAEREEAARTFYVKRQGAVRAVVALAERAFLDPRRFLTALALGLRLAGSDLRRIPYAVFYLLEAALVGRRMRAAGVRHLHVHFATPGATVGLLARRLWPITFSFTVHGPDEFYDAPGNFLAEKIAGADFVVCIGRFARSQLMKLSERRHWPKFEIAPLGVDTRAFEPRRVATGRPFEILCVGRLVPAKGQHVLLSAVERLVAEGRDVALRLVGDGPDRASLEARVRETGLQPVVRFEGAVDQDRIRSFYREADVFALASFAEGIPVVLMEAMAMEVPSIATCITGIPELIRDGVDGLLVAPSDDEALAQAIARLMDDLPLRRRLGAAGRERVRDRYELDRNVQRLAGIFERRLEACA